MKIAIIGGTGFLGRALVERLLNDVEEKHISDKAGHYVFVDSIVDKILVISRDEVKHARMKSQIDDPDNKVRYLVGDCRDKDRMRRALKGVDLVIHAAAMKRVEMCEYNPIEAVDNNINGTTSVIQACLDCNVKRMVFVSTDKAVEPINCYGRTKAVCESLVIGANNYSHDGGCEFVVVRYGNVTGSTGSVLEIWKNQGEVKTITEKYMSRFFMTINQAVSVVMYGLFHASCGNIVVPKLYWYYIEDLFDTAFPDNSYQMIGSGPGEKMGEVLLTGRENVYEKVEFEGLEIREVKDCMKTEPIENDREESGETPKLRMSPACIYEELEKLGWFE